MGTILTYVGKIPSNILVRRKCKLYFVEPKDLNNPCRRDACCQRGCIRMSNKACQFIDLEPNQVIRLEATQEQNLLWVKVNDKKFIVYLGIILGRVMDGIFSYKSPKKENGRA